MTTGGAMRRPTRLPILAFLLLLSSAPGLAAGDFETLKRDAETAYYDDAYERAKAVGMEALAVAVETMSADDPQLLDVHALVFGAAVKLGDLGEAERQATRVLAVLERNFGGPDGINAAFGLELLAHVHLLAGRAGEAERLFRKAIDNRSILTIGGEEGFGARHRANLAAVALARGDRQTALDGFSEAIAMISAGQTGSIGNEDTAVDIFNERNSWTFVGLAAAAWGLAEDGSPDPDALADRAFQAMQWRWRTSASAALFDAAARAYSDDPEKSRRQRDIDAIERELAAAEEMLAAHMAEAAADPAIQEFYRQQTESAAEINQEDLIRNMNESLRLTQALVELQEQCMSGRPEADLASPSCWDEIQPQVAELEAQIAAVAAEGQQIMAPMGPTPGGPSEEEKAHEARFGAERVRRHEEIGRLQEKLRSAQTDFERDYGADTGGGASQFTEPDPIAIPETQALLGEDTAIVAFLIGDERSFVFAVTNDDVAWSLLQSGGRQLREAVLDFRASLELSGGLRGAESAFDEAGGPVPILFDVEAAHALYRTLLGPIEAAIVDKPNLIVVPSGPLTGLPFHALVTDQPTGGLPDAELYAKTAWLARRHAVTVLPSVVSLRAINQFTATGGAELPFKGFGDPVLGDPPLRDAPQARGFASFFTGELANVDALRRLAPLPETAAELRAVATSLGAPESEIVLGPAATETAVKAAALDRYRIIHFATHGLVAGEIRGVAEPGLVMTPPPVATDDDDGLLSASEVMQLELNADWVVLSACNTAAGSTENAEPLSGLARAFFHAGARSLLVSHWPVWSDAAVKLTTHAFREMEADPALGRAEALRLAMVAMIDGPDPADAHPARWAPFSVVGKGWN